MWNLKFKSPIFQNKAPLLVALWGEQCHLHLVRGRLALVLFDALLRHTIVNGNLKLIFLDHRTEHC